MMAWLDMGGDGLYVWPCYALTIIVLLANLWVARRDHRMLLQRAEVRARMSAARVASSGADASLSEPHQGQSEETPT